MTQVVAKYTDRNRSDFLALEESATGAVPAWLRKLRRQAFARFEQIGLPIARRGNEEWKYTDVNPVTRPIFEYPARPSSQAVEADQIKHNAAWDKGWLSLIFADGDYVKTTGDGAIDNGVDVANLANAFNAGQRVVEEHLARYAGIEDNGFIALNTAFLRDGAFVYVPDNVNMSKPLHIIYLATEGVQPRVSYPRTLVVAGQHSRLTVIESFIGLAHANSFTNAVTEIALGDGAQVEHYRLLMEGPQAFHIGTTRVRQGQDSAFTSLSFSLGCAIARNDFHVLLDAPGSSCVLNGLYLTWENHHLDNHLSIDHVKPHTSSSQYFKGILGGVSQAVFSGRVQVHSGAQKSFAEQTDKNLLLSAGAEVDSKPSLEIFADDVQCRHGATAGQVAEDALFYLRSRGLDLETATGLLISGFASEIIDTVRLEPLRAYLKQMVDSILPNFQPKGAA